MICVLAFLSFYPIVEIYELSIRDWRLNTIFFT